MSRAMGTDGAWRNIDEHYDQMSDVQEDPHGAHAAIQNLWAENERLRDALQAMRGVFDTPIARRKHGGEYANEARKLAREAMTSTITLEEPHNG
tara:strand:- start:109 stop:390 length:282 start_codon:yes stop_codon:yes gene_type:complete